MHRFTLALIAALSTGFAAANAHGQSCRELFNAQINAQTLETGKFVSTEDATASERQILKMHAPTATSLLRPTHGSVLVLKTRLAGSVFDVVQIVGTKSGVVTHTLEGFDVANVAVSPNGEYAYVESREGGITISEPGINQTINSVPQFWRSSGMALTADGKALYTFSTSTREVIIIETRYLENGYPLPIMPGDGSRGSHIMPLTHSTGIKSVRQVTFGASPNGRFLVSAGDTGLVVVLDVKNEGRNVIPKVIKSDYSQILRDDFVSNRNPSRPTIRWVSDHSFEVSLRGKTEKFEFKLLED